MGWQRSVKGFIGLVVVFTASICTGLTDPRDVSAINSLYVALGYPPLRGWLLIGGDPCGDNWEGVECVFSNITTLNLNGLNLGGNLGSNLDFVSILTIDLSNNHIGGSIPPSLPLTIRNLSLSANQLSGSIPDSLSLLTQLSDLSLSSNLLTGGIPDTFQQLTGFINLDLSGNKLNGQLPPSLGNLPSLSTLHLQNNQLSGTLDVLQDLPLVELNIENNLFSGPIPEKLLRIPNFRKDGNPFNTSVITLPPEAQPPSFAMPPSFARPPSSEDIGKPTNGPSAAEASNSASPKTFFTTERVIWIAGAGALILVLLALGLFFKSRCCKGEQMNKNEERHDMGAYGSREARKHSDSALQQYNQVEKAPKETFEKPLDGYGGDHRRMGFSSKPQNEQQIDMKKMVASSRHRKDHEVDMTGSDSDSMQLELPPPPPPPFPIEKVIVNPIVPAEITTWRSPMKGLNSLSSIKVFTIASLQQYTNSFSQENLIGEGVLGSVYKAELPDGKQLAVKKLDTAVSSWHSDEEFLALVSSISKLQHANIVELVGYCVEHGQRLLVYKYYKNGTLLDVLHNDDEIHKKLSWNARIRMALGAARALEYLHEVCQPPIMHRNLKSSKILLDDEFVIRVSDCGLAPLISSGSASQLSGKHLITYGYAAPEFESGSYTCQSDVYSLGVVMLELLTGREAFDRSRPRGEQSLVRWAISQLHDIDALSRMVDPSLNGAYPIKALSRFADIISLCVQLEPEFRPPMSEIVQDLLYMVQREP